LLPAAEKLSANLHEITNKKAKIEAALKIAELTPNQRKQLTRDLKANKVDRERAFKDANDAMLSVVKDGRTEVDEFEFDPHVEDNLETSLWETEAAKKWGCDSEAMLVDEIRGAGKDVLTKNDPKQVIVPGLRDAVLAAWRKTLMAKPPAPGSLVEYLIDDVVSHHAVSVGGGKLVSLNGKKSGEASTESIEFCDIFAALPSIEGKEAFETLSGLCFLKIVIWSPITRPDEDEGGP
jgi:hypothetical protein